MYLLLFWSVLSVAAACVVYALEQQRLLAKLGEEENSFDPEARLAKLNLRTGAAIGWFAALALVVTAGILYQFLPG